MEGGREEKKRKREKEKGREREKYDQQKQDVAREVEKDDVASDKDDTMPSGQVEENDVWPDNTRHRRIKSTLSKYTIIFITPAEISLLRNIMAWNTVTDRSCVAPPRKFQLAFYSVSPTSSVELDTTYIMRL